VPELKNASRSWSDWSAAASCPAVAGAVVDAEVMSGLPDVSDADPLPVSELVVVVVVPAVPVPGVAFFAAGGGAVFFAGVVFYAGAGAAFFLAGGVFVFFFGGFFFSAAIT
jgi:hypothetical protein